MHAKRILSNNAVIADDDGLEVIAIGLGIGYQCKPGDEISSNAVERIFVPSAAEPVERLSAFLAELPPENLKVATAITALAAARLGIPPSQSLIIAIADHLSFAIQREKEGSRIDYPLTWEIAQLYPDHLEVGRQAVLMIQRELETALPEGEATVFAMHLINASGSTEPHSARGSQQLNLIGQIFDVIDTAFGVSVERESMSASRFVTHLRYVFTRIEKHVQIVETPTDILSSIERTYPDAVMCAHRITLLVQLALGVPVTSDETAFTALHVARLVGDLRGSDPVLPVEYTDGVETHPDDFDGDATDDWNGGPDATRR